MVVLRKRPMERVLKSLHDFKQVLFTRLGILNGAYAYKGPRRVELHLTNKCNHNCIVCWVRSPYLKETDEEYQKQELPYGIVIKLIGELRRIGICSIHISGGGEPLMHPKFWDILSYIKEQRIECRLNTNFSLLNEEDIKRLVSLKLDGLTVSLWAASPESYMGTHLNVPKDTFPKIERGLKLLSDLKKLKGQKIPIVDIYNVICNVNYKEIDEMVEFAKSCCADNCLFALADVIKGQTDIFSLSPSQEGYVIEKIKYWIKEDFNYDIDDRNFVKVTSYLHQLLWNKKRFQSDNTESPCYTGWMFSLVEASGNVSFCCKSTREPVGNIREDNFSKIWNSERQRKFRKSAISGNVSFKHFSSATCRKGCDNIEDNIWAHRILVGLGHSKRAVLSLLEKVCRYFLLYSLKNK